MSPLAPASQTLTVSLAWTVLGTLGQCLQKALYWGWCHNETGVVGLGGPKSALLISSCQGARSRHDLPLRGSPWPPGQAAPVRSPPAQLLFPSPHRPRGPARVWLWVSPRRGRSREGPLEMRPGLHPLSAVPLVAGAGSWAQTVSGQTWESTQGPFSKAGAVPRAPGGPRASFTGHIRAGPGPRWKCKSN